MRKRLDVRVAEALAVDRATAAVYILSGEITVDGQTVHQPGQLIPDGGRISRQRKIRQVSRATEKLAAGLNKWSFDCRGKIALDVGAGAGGFTQVLLKAGARLVYAVDVGKGQLAWTLLRDPRVINLPQTDIRQVTALPKPIDLATIDVSFISLRQVLPAVMRLVKPAASIFALFKPQFEVDKAVADRFRGVIADEQVRDDVWRDFKRWLTKQPWRLRTDMEAVVPGAKGNRERLCWLHQPRAAGAGRTSKIG